VVEAAKQTKRMVLEDAETAVIAPGQENDGEEGDSKVSGRRTVIYKFNPLNKFRCPCFEGKWPYSRARLTTSST